ncbi:MAG TPA: ABC transporter ATP-binding protein [Nannocystaceae bacterium]|nr:ABC transporter ATP-binding protein [Nannocystaceae bacterium]
MRHLLRFLRRYALRNLPHYALGLVMLLLTNYAVVRVPALIGKALTVLGESGPAAVDAGQQIALELMAWALALVVTRTLSRILFFNPGREVELRLSIDLLRHLLALQRPFYASRKIGELASVATNDIASVRLLIGFAGLQVFNVIVAIPMHLAQMWGTDPVLTLWCLAPVLVGALYMQRVVSAFYGLIRRSLELLAGVSDRILETYSGVATIRAHGSERAMIHRFDERNDEYLSLLLKISRLRAFAMPVLTFSGLVGTAFVLWIGGDRVIAGQLAVGDIATFTALLVSLVGLLTAVAWVLTSISRGLVALGRIGAVIDTPTGVPPARDTYALTAPPALEIRGLSFTYPGAPEPVLRDISARVGPGRTLGIFGRTGAGKTTLVHLLARVYTPPAGAIRLDGHDLVDLDLDRLRAGTAVVPQDPFLFSTTVRDNIRLKGERTGHVRGDDADAGASDAWAQAQDPALDRVLDASCLKEDIRALQSGLDTVVGERGVMLSGGQRQRVALARALYRAPPLLLLDDVLSAVDQGTEARLVAAIRGLRAQAGGAAVPTTVIVSHRTSVLEHADEILVLDGGRVIERGTHEQLLARGGVYADTHAHQGVEGEAPRDMSKTPAPAPAPGASP